MLCSREGSRVAGYVLVLYSNTPRRGGSSDGGDRDRQPGGTYLTDPEFRIYTVPKRVHGGNTGVVQPVVGAQSDAKVSPTVDPKLGPAIGGNAWGTSTVSFTEHGLARSGTVAVYHAYQLYRLGMNHLNYGGVALAWRDACRACNVIMQRADGAAASWLESTSRYQSLPMLST